MDVGDLELFERSLRHATEQHTGAALDDALAELGWPDALADDPRVAVSLLFELQGAATSTSSALDQVVLGALGVAGPDGVGVVLPDLGSTVPPGTIDGVTVAVDGLGSAALLRSDRAVVVASSGDGDVVLTVPTASLDLLPVRGMDPRFGLVRVSGEAIAVDEPPVPGAPWADVVAQAQLAVAHELVGTARLMLAQACEHALQRVQFDRPISQFQAVRHRLAETLVAIETADAVAAAAWDNGSPVNAAMAKALAGRGARTASRHCQQVLAGIGFTTEHPLHLSIRRTLVLDELFGSARTLTRQLGDDLLATRQLPPLGPL